MYQKWMMLIVILSSILTGKVDAKERTSKNTAEAVYVPDDDLT